MRFLIGMFCVLFALLSWEAKAQEKVPITIYCLHREFLENLGRITQEEGFDAANAEIAKLIHRSDDECRAYPERVPFFVVAHGPTYRSDGSILEVVGLAVTESGDIIVWAIYITHDGST